MDTVRIGVLSHAHGHINSYCDVLRGCDDVRLVATWDADEDRGRRAAERFGLERRTSAAAVVDDPQIDAVLIGSETNRHADLVELAAAAGKAILLQKPMATTLADCDRILAAVEIHGVRFSMAFQMRHDPVNQRMKGLLDEGLVGRPFILRRRHCIGVLLNPAFATGDSAWHVDATANVGMFFDDATHAADWFLWMLGPPRSVVAEIDAIVTDSAPDDNGIALFRFAGGVIGELHNSSTTVAAIGTTEIYGDAGTILQDYGDAPSTAPQRPTDAVPLRSLRRGDDAWTEYRLAIPASHGERIAAVPRPFIDYLRGGGPAPVTASEGRASVEMVLGAYQAAATGRRVTFPLTPGDGRVTLVWIALIATVGLFALSLHTWMTTAQRSSRLQGEIDHVQSQVRSHSEKLQTLRSKVDRTKQETGNLLKERDRLETEVLEKRRMLGELEERLERARPKSRRVDKTEDDELFG